MKRLKVSGALADEGAEEREAMGVTMSKPHCQLLRQERLDEFNRIARVETVDLVDSNLRSIDLRLALLRTADLRGAYLRGADLRGVDLSEAKLEGASLHEAKVSGVLFPADFDAAEIRLSIEYGSRLRALSSRVRAAQQGLVESVVSEIGNHS